MTDVTDLLERAIARISDPDKWTKGTLARTPDGVPADPTDVDNPECAVCLVGALQAAEDISDPCTPYADATDTLRWIIAQLYPERIDPEDKWGRLPDFNDHPDTTWHDVVGVLQLALTVASGGGTLAVAAALEEPA